MEYTERQGSQRSYDRKQSWFLLAFVLFAVSCQNAYREPKKRNINEEVSYNELKDLMEYYTKNKERKYEEKKGDIVMFKFKTRFGEYNECEFLKEGTGSHVRYSVFSREDGPIMKLNLPGYTEGLGEKLEKENIVAVFDYSENEGTMDFLDKLGVVKRAFGYLQSGYVDIPVVELDTKKLMELNECKEIDFTSGMALDKDGNPKSVSSISITDFDKAVEALEKQDGYEIADGNPIYRFKIQNVAKTEIEVRPVKGEKNVCHITELSPLFGGVVQDYFATVNKEKLFEALGVPLPKEKETKEKGSLKPKRQAKVKSNTKDNEREG